MTKINQSFENEYFMRDFFSVFVAKETYLYSSGKSPSHKIGFIRQKKISGGTPTSRPTACNFVKLTSWTSSTYTATLGILSLFLVGVFYFGFALLEVYISEFIAEVDTDRSEWNTK